MFKIKDSFEGYTEGTLADRRSLYFSHRLRHVRGHAPPPRTENRDCDFYSIPLLRSWDVEGLYCDVCFQEDKMWIEGTSPAPSEAWFIFQEVMVLFPLEEKMDQLDHALDLYRQPEVASAGVTFEECLAFIKAVDGEADRRRLKDWLDKPNPGSLEE